MIQISKMAPAGFPVLGWMLNSCHFCSVVFTNQGKIIYKNCAKHFPYLLDVQKVDFQSKMMKIVVDFYILWFRDSPQIVCGMCCDVGMMFGCG